MRAVHIVFAGYSIFVAANQHLRRAIIDENHVCPGVGGMREMHKAAAGHSIFVAANQHRRVPHNVMKMIVGRLSYARNAYRFRQLFYFRSSRRLLLRFNHP